MGLGMAWTGGLAKYYTDLNAVDEPGPQHVLTCQPVVTMTRWSFASTTSIGPRRLPRRLSGGLGNAANAATKTRKRRFKITHFDELCFIDFIAFD